MQNFTIIYTDVVGYSKLTGEDQELALELLSEHDKILHQNTKHYSGNIVKKTGDGICALFENPDNAIKCCIDIQKDLNKRNKLNIKERQVKIRIGIHHGTVSKKTTDYFGDNINIAKEIESNAPHGGIAISETVNDLIWDAKDIYIRDYSKINYENKELKLFEVYLDLIKWFENEKNQTSQNVPFDKTYKIAHDFFHKGDYSAAIKFAILSLQNITKNKKYEVNSFVCNTFISLGEFEYCKEGIEYLKNNKTDDITIELEAHLLKMEGLIFFNNKEWVTAKNLFIKAFDLMQSVNTKYINEIIFYLGNIYLNDHSIDELSKYLDYIEYDDDYKILIDGILLAAMNTENEKTLNAYDKSKEKIENDHLKSIAHWYMAIYFNNYKVYKNAEKHLSESHNLLINASENISDWFQREKFLKNIYIHTEITNFADSNFTLFDDLDIKIDDEVEKEKNLPSEEDNNIYKFCPSCGNGNENNYKFCINCGNDLQY